MPFMAMAMPMLWLCHGHGHGSMRRGKSSKFNLLYIAKEVVTKRKYSICNVSECMLTNCVICLAEARHTTQIIDIIISQAAIL